jgi:hypothetical protein
MRGSVVAERLQSMVPELREQLLGGAAARTIEAELERIGAVRCFFLDASVGVVFGVDLADGTRVALKLHQEHVDEAQLRAVQAVQSHLAASGFP